MVVHAIKGKSIQIIFKNRAIAGDILAASLKGTLKGNNGHILVLAIPSGGIIVADAIGTRLSAQLSVIIPRELRSPYKENYIGAIMHDGFTYLDESQISLLKPSPEHIESQKKEQLKEISRLITKYRLTMSLQDDYDIEEKTVVLVNDGLVSSPAIIAAARWIRKRRPKRLIIAAPVAAKQIVELLKKECDLVQVTTVNPYISNIGECYQEPETVTDERVIEILQRWYAQ